MLRKWRRRCAVWKLTLKDGVPWTFRGDDAAVHHARETDAVIEDVDDFLHFAGAF